ncbi:hypothetical protein CK203_079791 [Vitis vinifera]|uniref:RNase H type-1 domain-containing protein n=1 Tax=Vitis vinifera TaxID=29760 RepID=A0A438EC81_VITVI|nr:hypothetical protein CK203_079791 [Vitis vinifera]
MKLNPSKCAFGVSAGKFLGFMVSQRGIEVSPDQVKAVMETPPPRNKKELQRLTGKLVALGRFIARFTDELRPFFLAIRKAGTQGMTDNCQNALERIKLSYASAHLEQPHPKGEAIYVFSCLRMGNQRRSIPLPFAKGAETCLLCQQSFGRCRNQVFKNGANSLSSSKCCSKAPPLFSSPPSDCTDRPPLRSILHKPDLTGRMLQWAIELSEFGIEFQPRLSKKGQVMADFVLEYSRRPNQHHESIPNWGTSGEQPSGWDSPRLTMKQNTRPSCPDWTSPCAIRLQTPIYSDSQLVVRHVQKEYEAKDSRMARYLAKVRSTLQQFTEWTIEKIKRADNGRADALAEYLRTGTLPEDPKQAHKIRVQAARFTLIGGTCTSDPSQGLIFAVLGIQRPSPWPFAQWGMDIVGPLPAAPAQKKFLLVATDYFSKWVEAEAYASIKDKDHCIQEFLFGIEYPEFILHATLSSKQWPGGSHKQNSNQCLKEKAGASQREVGGGLPGVLWAYRTTPGRPTGNTPFALTYGMDAVIPTEIGLPTIRTDAAKQKDANTELGRNLDWADEVRESASIRMADYQQRASAHYNRKVRPRNFKNGTLVLRKVFENTAEVGAGKFQANWEGPYIVSKANENGAYHLQKLDGTPLLRPWNVLI